MGGAFAHYGWEQNKPAMQGVQNIEQYGQNVGLGVGGKTAKSIINQMRSGDYSNLAGTLLSPIHDVYAAQGRDLAHKAITEGNALYAGTQPALMAAIGQDTKRKMAEQEGLAMGQGISGLLQSQQGVFQNALNARRGLEMGALQSGLSGRLAANQLVQRPGWLNQVAGALGTIGGGAMGLAGLGGLFRGSPNLPMGGPTSANIGSYANLAPPIDYSGLYGGGAGYSQLPPAGGPYF